MLHEFSQILSEQSTTDNAVVVAIVSAAGLVLSALVTAWLGTRGERRPVQEHDDDDELEAQCHALRERVYALEVWLWRHRLDPTRIKTGEEDRDDIAMHEL